ncbi:putative membrane protein YczE [Labedella gwakjiensis]|uniref:Putative membrane protein YczE n=1 Tax=Labedella gwakjiensis TaxID=390269 RepID=A0A2P8GSJ0_9MICO|nr:hypothetical protein [Labedella gwakjiensis]PSL36936.1 putative membrane protein YczE [Labedella gwakjiensis]RUQ81758.1 hypothetical protein ELQ93_17825 [Labedella gwakjiensis]
MLRRISQLLIGLVLYGVADALMIRAVLGVDPWTVLSQGLSIHTGLGIGILTNIVGVLVLLLWIPLRQRPGVGTILNILIIGPSIELGLWLVPPMTELWAQILMFAAGLVLLAVASGLYIGARMGPGPRDGLMTGINKRFGVPIWIARTSVEITVLVTGWILGGNVGLGTVAFALLIGPLCNITLPFFAIRAPAVTPEAAPEAIDASESRPPTTPLPLIP